jgi:hypothetical protein
MRSKIIWICNVRYLCADIETAHSKLRDTTVCLELQKITFNNWKVNILTNCLSENLGPWSKQDIVCVSGCFLNSNLPCLSNVVFTRNTEARGLLGTTEFLVGIEYSRNGPFFFWTANACGHNIIRFLWIKVLNRFIKYINIDEIQSAINAMKLGKISPVRGLEWPRGFQEVEVPRFRDNGTGWW